MLGAVQVIGFASHERDRLHKNIEFADVYHSAHRITTGSDMVPIVLPRIDAPARACPGQGFQ